MAREPIIRAFFDEPTNTVSYLVADPATRQAAVIDPVLDYDHNAGEVDTRSVEAILKAADEAGYTIEWTLETHAHADHLSGSPYIKAKTGAKIGIGEHIKDVQRIFRPVFNATDLKTDGSDFDHLFQDGERFQIGELEAEVLYTPGPHAGRRHLQDRGRGVRRRHAVHAGLRHRARRFPGRRRASALPLDPAAAGAAARDAAVHVPRLQGARAATTMPGRPRSPSSGEKNVHVRDGVTEDEFVAMRTARDATLAASAPPAALDPGQHPRRQVPARRGERRPLPDDPGEAQEPGRRDPS